MALDFSDIAGHRNESLGQGTLYFRDHFHGFDSATTTGYYSIGGATQSDLFNRANEVIGGASATWGGTGLPIRSSRVVSLGGGKAVRTTRYGRPRFGTIDRINKTYTMKSRVVEKPWLLVNSLIGTGGFPLAEDPPENQAGAKMLAYNRTSSGHFLPIQRVYETLIDFTFTDRNNVHDWNRTGPMINRINSNPYTIAMPGAFNQLSFDARVLRFNSADFFSRKESGTDVFYNVYSFTYSAFGWRYQYIEPLGNDPTTGEPIVPTAGDVTTARLYEGVTFGTIPSGG